MINGHTELIAHIGYPTHSFKSPMIYNPYFEQVGVNAVVVPMGCKPNDYPAFLKHIFALTNIRGALITMPHKIVTVGLLDDVTPTVRVTGAKRDDLQAAMALIKSELKDLPLSFNNFRD